MKEWRTGKARKLKIALFQILHQRVAVQITVTLPQSLGELEQKRGVGSKSIAKFGQQLMDMITAYRCKHGIEQVILPERTEAPLLGQSVGKRQKKDTRQAILDLFKKTIARLRLPKPGG